MFLQEQIDKEVQLGRYSEPFGPDLLPGMYSMCYDSFFFIRRSSFALLPSLRTVLWNAFCLNTASFLHAVHGSLTPFPPTFYGRPSLTCVTSTQLLPIYRTAQAFPLYPPWFLCYEHCLVRVLHSHLFKR